MLTHAAKQSESPRVRPIVRSATVTDLAAVLNHLKSESAGSPWLERIPELAEQALRGDSAEYEMCVAEVSEEFVGCGIYGSVAGTAGTATLYFVSVEKRSAGSEAADAIIAHVLSDLAGKGARLVVAEVPGHESFDSYRSLLEGRGFVEESRIEDYYRDEVPLLHYRFDPP